MLWVPGDQELRADLRKEVLDTLADASFWAGTIALSMVSMAFLIDLASELEPTK